MTVELNLTVNGIPIRTDYFVASFIDHTVSGIIESLEGTDQIKDLDLTINGDKVSLVLNGANIPLNLFAGKIIRSTIAGMVSTLKGVSEIKTIKITVRK